MNIYFESTESKRDMFRLFVKKSMVVSFSVRQRREKKHHL